MSENLCLHLKFLIILEYTVKSMSKPGEQALIAMQALNKQISIFKKPQAPKAKKRKTTILTEEKYMQELGKIIQRDFFPDLEKLKAQNEYLDAISKNDLVKLRQIFSKYNSKSPLARQFASPATFETPLPSEKEPQSVRSLASTSSTKSNRTIADSHTLDSFLQNYTSEDDDSFQEIIEAADKKLRQKFAVLYDAEETSRQILDKSLALPSIEKQFDQIEKPREVDMWKYTNKNYIMYIPDGVELTKEEQLEMAKLKQEIVHNNTRLLTSPFNEKESQSTITELAKTQSKCLGNNKIGVDGKVVDNSMSPNVRGFNFVKTPSPCPGANESPLFTWGEIEGTPFRLDGGDTPLHNTKSGPSFRITETSKRENLALQLAGNVSEKSRIKKANAMEAARRNIASPYIRNSLDRLASMSPAAKRLASAKLGLRESLMSSSPLWSPASTTSMGTPKQRTPRKKPTPSGIRKKTPIVISSSSTTSATSSEMSTTLTDNLLAIPSKRPKAADFF